MRQKSSWASLGLSVTAALFLLAPRFTFMKSKFFMNHLYFFFFSCELFAAFSFLKKSELLSRTAAKKAEGACSPAREQHTQLIALVGFYFSSAVCAVTPECKAQLWGPVRVHGSGPQTCWQFAGAALQPA